MTSFIAAGGSGRSTSFIPAVPAAWSVTTIAFMVIFSSVICLFAGNVAALESLFDISCQGPWVASQVALSGLIGRSRPIWTAPAGRAHRWARVAHGRTRTIVFPLILLALIRDHHLLLR